MKIEVIESLVEKGIQADSYQITALRVSQGRVREELNVDLAISLNTAKELLLSLKVFKGRYPYYKPWIEVFNMKPEIRIGLNTLYYFDSNVEDVVLSMVASALEPGERVFVEYFRDSETMKALMENVPPPATRLGFKLFKLGFTWFKDWYFPEGFMEGGPKLQAEKPLNETHRARNLRRIRVELEEFIKANMKPDEIVVEKAVSRAIEALKLISKMVEYTGI